MMPAYFDAHLSTAATPHADLRGAIIFGEHARQTGMSAPPFISRPLDLLIGPNDSRYPQDADVLDITFTGEPLRDQLLPPLTNWWPLCGVPRADGRPLVLHFKETHFGMLAKGLSRLARAFPAVRFMLDPFVPGKESNWKAGVCLAEHPNIWLTTRGLYEREDLWPRRADREAFHFVIGEVGAGRLLFASGEAAANQAPGEWLESIPFLDDAQCRLILFENAIEMLGQT